MMRLRRVTRYDHFYNDQGGIVWIKSPNDYYIYRLHYNEKWLVAEWFHNEEEIERANGILYRLLNEYRFVFFNNFTHGLYSLYWKTPWGLVPVDEERYHLVDENLINLTQAQDGYRTDSKFLIRLIQKHMLGEVFVYLSY